MNINKRLRKIQRELAKMETSASGKPKERKGTYVQLFDSEGIYKSDWRKSWQNPYYFVGQLISNPIYNKFDNLWEARFIYDGADGIKRPHGTNFWKCTGIWRDESPMPSVWALDVTQNMRRVNAPDDWDPETHLYPRGRIPKNLR